MSHTSCPAQCVLESTPTHPHAVPVPRAVLVHPHHRWTTFITQTDQDQTSSEWIDIDIEMEAKLNSAYDEVRVKRKGVWGSEGGAEVSAEAAVRVTVGS